VGIADWLERSWLTARLSVIWGIWETRLARLRRLADVTQEGLAEWSGVSVEVIRKLE
jgi:hypothetical protein